MEQNKFVMNHENICRGRRPRPVSYTHLDVYKRQLQIVGQKELDPTIASMAMCMESVFSALAGWLILGQTLSGVELAGCALMFAAIIGAQIPEKVRS